MKAEQWWNGTDTGKPNQSEKYLSQSHFSQHESHIDWPGIEAEPRRWQADDLKNWLESNYT
jgi:hypothetical protein